MPKLIVNADDFGISESVNEGIVEAYLNGIVTSTSIMANGKAFEHAVTLAHNTPNLGVGIHLSLVGEMPIVDSQRVPTLVSAEGCLHGSSRVFALKYLTKKLDFDELECELDAQFIKVLEAGIDITHVDGHQHLHMFPQVFDIVNSLCKKHGIKVIRIPLESTRLYWHKLKGKKFRLLELMVLNFFCYMAKRKTELKAPDYFFGFFYGGELDKFNLMDVLTHLPEDGVSEIMCHPGKYANENEYEYEHWNYNWMGELNALKSNDVKAFIEKKSIELVSYKNFYKI